MQQQVDGHLRPEQQMHIPQQAQPTGEQQHEQQHNYQLQQHHHQSQHADQQPLAEPQHAWQPQHRGGDGETSPVRGRGEAGGVEDNPQPQFMAWPGGATLASALWNAQEKVVHHFKQLQLLENPFAATSTATREAPPHRGLATENAHTPSQRPQSASSSPSLPPLQGAAGDAAQRQTAAPAAAGGPVAAEGEDRGAGGEGRIEGAVTGLTNDESGAAAAAAAALDAVPLHAVTAETLGGRRSSTTKPAAALLRHDTTPYRLVTFANGRPHHVHHICSPTPHAGARSLSMPGKTNREHPPHEAAAAATEPLCRTDSPLRPLDLHEEEDRSEWWTPAAFAAGADAAEAGAGEDVPRTLDPQESQIKRSAAAAPAAAGEDAFLETLFERKSSSRDDTGEGNSNRSSKGTGVRRLLVGGEEARRPSPAVGDVEAATACMASSLAPATAVSLENAAAGVRRVASNTGAPDVAAVSSSPRQSAAAGASKAHLRPAAPVHSSAAPANLSVAGNFPAAAAEKVDSPVQLAAARCAAQTATVFPGAAAAGASAVLPSFLTTPGAAYEAEGAGDYAATADATGRVALLQLIAATRQLSSVSWQLLLLCVLLPLVYFLYFLSSPPSSEKAAAAAADHAAGHALLPSSSCVESTTSLGFVVHALITVYLLVVGNAAWNLWKLELPREMFLYSHLGCLLPAAQGREDRGTTRPQRAASTAAGAIAAGAGTQAAAVATGGAPVRRTVSAAAGYGGGYLARYSLGLVGGGSGIRPAIETGRQDGESNEGANVIVASAADAVDSVEPPTNITDEVVNAEDGNRQKEVLQASRKSSEDETVLPPCVSSFPSSASISTSSDTARAAESCRYEPLENPPPPAAAPAPPPSDWPQWPVLLRATQEPWIVDKTQEVLQRQLNRMRRRSVTSKQKEKEHFFPTLKYPAPPLLFMTPDVLDPRQAVVSFQTPFFRGSLFICIPSPGSSATKKQQGPYGKRAMQACVQGQFLQPYRVGEILTGQAFFRPLRSLPPQWMVSLGLKVAKQLTSTLQEDIFARMPYFLTPAVCSVETLHVAHSKRSLSEEGGRKQLLQTQQCRDEEEEYIPPPDVTLLDVPEETRLLGGPFAHGGVSAQQRKSMLSNKQLLRDIVFDPDLIYTFNFVQNIFYPSTYEFDLGIMKLDLAPFLNQQPIEVMALIDDTFVRDTSVLSRRQSLQQQQKQKHQMQNFKKKKKKENRVTREGEKNARPDGEQEARATRGEGTEGVEDAEVGQGRRKKRSSEGIENEATPDGLFKEGAEEEEHQGTEGEDDEEPEDADPRRWVPPDNGRKFVWQFQMWHAKLLVKQD